MPLPNHAHLSVYLKRVCGGEDRSGTCPFRVLSGKIEHEEAWADDLMIGEAEVAQAFRLLCSSLAHKDSALESGW